MEVITWDATLRLEYNIRIDLIEIRYRPKGVVWIELDQERV
jgi:hypothetical protein